MKNSPAYGRRNVQTVTTGTGEAPVRPAALRRTAVGEGWPYNRPNREVGHQRVGESEAAICTDRAVRTT